MVAGRYPALLVVLAIGAAALGGCASQPERNAAGTEQAAYAGPRVPIEDDGLPVQLGPRDRPSEPDDPSQPWSRNYGSVVVKAASDAQILPQVFPILASSTSIAQPEQDAIIRRAIAEHEMRRQ